MDFYCTSKTNAPALYPKEDDETEYIATLFFNGSFNGM